MTSVGYRVYVNNEPAALISYQQNTAVIKDLLPDTEYRFDSLKNILHLIVNINFVIIFCVCCFYVLLKHMLCSAWLVLCS